MNVQKKEGVIIVNNYESFVGTSNYNTKIISRNTVNTWQPNRSEKEKMADTSLGKIAESIFEKYITRFSLQYLSYDDFRENNFEKHAPFDGLLFSNKKENEIKFFTNRINKEVSESDYGKVSVELLSDLTRNQIYTIEVKSTRINDRHKRNGKVDLATIKRDDFLTYPSAIRKSIKDYTFSGYADLLVQTGKISVPSGSEKVNIARKYEKQFMMDFYVRVYIDEQTKTGYIMGFISKNQFIKNAVLKRMFKKNKSELPLYLATPISYGKSIDDLIENF